MKAAICFSGIVGGTLGKNGLGEDIDYDLCYNYFKKFVIEPNNCDVFIHSWSVEHEKDLVRLYEPKKYAFEPQIDFYAGLENKDAATKSGGMYRFRSKWYSAIKSLELMKDYEEYDWVILARFDLMFLQTLDLNKFDLNYIHTHSYPIKIKPSKEQILEGKPYKNAIGDIFFFGSYDNILKLALDEPKDWFYDPFGNPHKAMYRRVSNTFGGDIQDIVKTYGWPGDEWVLCRNSG